MPYLFQIHFSRLFWTYIDYWRDIDSTVRGDGVELEYGVGGRIAFLVGFEVRPTLQYGCRVM